MENPATWGIAERIIHSVMVQHEQEMRQRVIGLSLSRKIADALREAGLLAKEKREDLRSHRGC